MANLVKGLWKMSSELLLLSAFGSPGVHSPCDGNDCLGISLGDKVRSARVADNPAVKKCAECKSKGE